MTISLKKIPGPWLALGLAANFLARREPFGSFRSSDLIRTLSRQIQRGHYLFALDSSAGDAEARVVGYLGWSLYDHATADRFAATGVPPAEDLAEGGDVVWILTAAAADRRAFFALAKAGRALYPAHRVMAVRHKQGRRVVFDQWRGRAAGRRDREGGPGAGH
ncbi:hypothetical protein KXR53_14615 [Inquilinus limosus]|uniref:hypothetical protein n=1 Tax=Inquilinus limosus TaxID=171674 RepID=UPI003F14DECC